MQIGHVAGDRKAPHVGFDVAASPRQMLRLARVERMTAARGLGHHRVSRVFVDLELRKRIGDEKNVHEGPVAPCWAWR